MADNVTNEPIFETLKAIRTDQRDMRSMMLQIMEALARHDRRFNEVERRSSEVERRISDLTGELELMLKAEVMGRFSQIEMRLDERMEELASRIERH
jgi:tetrahydromethanopterin S-methyltransferase subunit G